MARREFAELLDEHLRAGYQCLHVTTSEEARCETEIGRVVKSQSLGMITWDFFEGFSAPENIRGQPKYRTPAEALRAVVGEDTFKGNQLFVFRDLDDFFPDPVVRRTLKSLTEGNRLVNKKFKRPIVIITPTLKIHDKIKTCMTPIDFNLPDEAKLRATFKFVKASIESSDRTKSECSQDLEDQIVQCLMGLTANEAENALARCLVRHGGFKPDMLWTIKDEKAAIVKKSEVLTYIPETGMASRDEIGGFDLLLEFIDRRRLAYTRAAREERMDYPKGVVLLGVPGTGKCLGRGTPVLMFDGTVKCAENVVAGDQLMGPDSTLRTVLSTTVGCGPLYRVTPTKGDSYVINDAHILSLKRTGTEEIVNLSVADYLAKGEASRDRLKGWRTGVTWPEQAVTIPPYVLGVWLGDGTSTAPYVTTADPEVVAELQAYAAAVGVNFRDYGAKGLAHTYGLTKDKGGRDYDGNAFYEGLRQYNLFANKHIPQEYLMASREQRLELLAGIADTDGSLSCGGYEIPTKFGQLASDILFLARSLGFAAYVTPREKYDQDGRGGIYHFVFISGDTDQIPVRIPHKKAGPREQIKDVLKTGITVEPCGTGDYFGFELDGDRLFLLGDFTVTHNSYVAKAVSRLLGLPGYIMDVGSVFGSLVGESEARMRDALRQVDAQQGCVLLLDEADKAFGGAADSTGDSGVTRRVFGQLLTWLADKNDKTFVIMTLNRTKGIPPEFLRAGRFDAVFYTDLPHDQERQQILDIHLKKRGVDKAATGMVQTDWDQILEKTDGFVGSELEELIREARYIAFQNRQTGTPNLAEVMEAAAGIVPISKLDEEGVKAIREFCNNRAKPVSSPPKKARETKRSRAINVN